MHKIQNIKEQTVILSQYFYDRLLNPRAEKIPLQSP